jgi:hypothetical protein
VYLFPLPFPYHPISGFRWRKTAEISAVTFYPYQLKVSQVKSEMAMVVVEEEVVVVSSQPAPSGYSTER